MKKENNAGYSLIEVLAAILLLGILSVPLCNSLVMGHKMNVKSQTLLQAQLEVSAAVEQLMAEGITEEDETYDVTEGPGGEDRFPDVKIKTIQAETDSGELLPYYEVTVTSETDLNVSVITYIRAAESESTEPSGEGGDAS